MYLSKKMKLPGLACRCSVGAFQAPEVTDLLDVARRDNRAVRIWKPLIPRVRGRSKREPCRLVAHVEVHVPVHVRLQIAVGPSREGQPAFMEQVGGRGFRGCIHRLQRRHLERAFRLPAPTRGAWQRCKDGRKQRVRLVVVSRNGSIAVEAENFRLRHGRHAADILVKVIVRCRIGTQIPRKEQRSWWVRTAGEDSVLWGRGARTLSDAMLNGELNEECFANL